MTEDLIKLAEAIKDIQMTMFTTVEEDGCLFSRPMATLKVEPKNFDGKIYFFTDRNAPKVSSIRGEEHVNLAYSEPAKQKYISVSGRANMLEDKALMEKLWSPTMKAWFPEGLEDPSLGLICVEVIAAELWDAPPSKVVQLAGLAKAMATGQRYDGEKHHHHFEVRGH